MVPSILNVFFRLRYQSAGPTSTPWLASQTIYFLPIIRLFYSSHPRISLVEEKYEIIWNAAAVTYYLISLPARNAGVRSCLVFCVAGSYTLQNAKRKITLSLDGVADAIPSLSLVPLSLLPNSSHHGVGTCILFWFEGRVSRVGYFFEYISLNVPLICLSHRCFCLILYTCWL